MSNILDIIYIENLLVFYTAMWQNFSQILGK